MCVILFSYHSILLMLYMATVLKNERGGVYTTITTRD